MDEVTEKEIEEVDSKLNEVGSQKNSSVSLQGNLRLLSLASIPLGYYVSFIPRQYGTHAVFAMTALFILVSLTTSVQHGRYIGLLLAALWATIGIMFYNMRGI